MTFEIIISHIMAIVITMGALMIWKKYSHSAVENVVFAISVWLTAASFLSLITQG